MGEIAFEIALEKNLLGKNMHLDSILKLIENTMPWMA